MRQTASYGLSKPEKTDSVSIDVLNENMDKVDAALKELSQKTAASIHGSGHAAGGADPITPDMIGAADNALSNLPDPAAALAQIGAAGNSNLLENWYFSDPIDQRQGYVVPPDTPYYSGTALTTQAGTVSTYTTAAKVDDTYGAITVDGTEYYVAWSAAVRGYAPDGSGIYTIDRWFTTGGVGVTPVLIHDRCVELIAPAAIRGLGQRIKNYADYADRKVTFSALVDLISGEYYMAINDGAYHRVKVTAPGMNLVQLTTTISDAPSKLVAILDGNTTEFRAKIYAAKLELGATQTLAHQDGDGNWVLNDPPPDRAAELLKCCMSAADTSDAYANNKVTPAAVGAAAMEVVSYVGTGLHGSDNPCQATFSFAPKLVLGLFAVGSSGTASFFPSATNYNDYSVSVDWAMLPGSMTTQWQSGAGLGKSTSWGSYWLKQYGKKSADGKTLYWYQDDDGLGDSEGASFQLNTANTTYYLIAFA